MFLALPMNKTVYRLSETRFLFALSHGSGFREVRGLGVQVLCKRVQAF